MINFYSKILKQCLPAFLLLFVLLGIQPNLSATHYAGGYLRIECVGGNQYKVYVHRYRDLTGVAFGNQVNVNVDPRNANEGPDRDFTATKTIAKVLPIPKTNPCHLPPEQSSIQLEEHIYETPVFTLNSAPSGYNIYIDPACCRNGEIINIVPNSQILYTRSSDRQEFNCNSSPEFTKIPPLELCLGDTLDFDASAEDPDGGFDNSTLTITQSPMHGTVSANTTNGKITYTPNGNYVGIDSFNYRICDKGTPSRCEATTVYIDVKYENIPPQATDDYMATTVGEQIDKNLQANDIDFDAGLNPASLKVLENPKQGDIWYLSNGEMRYVPNDTFVGLDSMTYKICDAGNPIYCDTAKVFITVSNSINPTLAFDDYHTFSSSTTNILILNNDQAFFSGIYNPSIKILKKPKHGNASVLVNKIFYKADKKSSGLDSLQYLVCNDESPRSCDSAWVYITKKPNDFPPMALDDTISMTINNSINIDVLANDFDQIESLSYSDVVINEPAWHGSASVGNNGIDYTPPTGFFGLDSFSYKICDPQPEKYCDFAKVYVLVQNENYKPFAYSDQYLLDHNSSGTFDILNNDFDKDGQLATNGSVTLLNGPSNGTATVNGVQVNYAPANGFNGIDEFTYAVCDNGNPNKCDTAKVTVFVKANNYLPFVAADTALPYCFNPININVLGNDNIFKENLDVSSLNVISGPQHGMLVQNPDNSFTYQADSGYVGPDQFIYELCDDNGDCDSDTVFINYGAINLPPNAVSDSRKIGEGTYAIIDLLRNDSDPEDAINPSSFELIENPGNGQIYVSQQGEMLYEPSSNFVGIDSFTYKICDDGVPTKCDEATVYITVIGNTPPQVNDDIINADAFGPTAIRVLANDLISAGSLDLKTLEIKSTPSYGFAAIDFRNRFVYYPTDSSPSKSDQFTYSICNDGTPKQCGTATVTINLDYNEPPSLADDNYSVEYGNPTFIAPLANDTDTDGVLKRETLEIVSLPSNGDIAIVVDSGMVYRPNDYYSGSDQFSYKVCDDGRSVYCRTATVNISVSQKQKPVAQDDQFDVPLNETTRLNLTQNDSDPDGDLDKKSVRVIEQPVHGLIYNNVNGEVYYHPNTDFFGVDSFMYLITDMSNPIKMDTAHVMVTVGNSIGNQLAVDDNFSIDKNAYNRFDIAANDDPSIDLGTFKILNYFNNGNALIENTGFLYYKPNENYFGNDTLKYLVCDGPERLNCDTASVYFDVQDVSYPISANDDVVDVYDEHYRKIFVLENDYDRDRATAGFTLSVVSQPSEGTATVVGDAIAYNVTSGNLGPDQFQYEVCDNLGCETATVYINIVSGQNIAPTTRRDNFNTHVGETIVENPIKNDVDPDKDSLAYRFCAALETDNPYNRGQMPPFPTVTYVAPHTPTYPVQSNPALSINSKTGLLTGVPTQQGAHVITQCVEEYKNGRFLSDTRREIQVTIVPCTNQPIADIPGDPGTPNLILDCVDNTIEFENNGEADSFLWDFGIPGVASDTSTEVEPTFTYPDTGTYTVTLYAEPGVACENVDQITVKIYRSPVADFTYDKPVCQDQQIEFKDASDPVNRDIAFWQWTIGGVTSKFGKNVIYPGFSSSGNKTVRLQVTSETGCTDDVTKQVDVKPSPTLSMPNFDIMCVQDTLTLEAQTTGAANVDWSPQNQLHTTGNMNIVKVFKDSTGGTQYTAVASNQFGCEVSEKTVIQAIDRPTIDAGDPLRLCTSPFVQPDITTNGISFPPSWKWEPSVGVSDTSISEPQISPNQTTTYTITLSKDTGKYCVESDTLKVFANLPSLDIIAEKQILCANDFTQLAAQTDAERATFDWAPANSLSDPAVQYPLATPSATTTYTVTMYDSVSQCTVMDTITLEVKQVSGLSAGNDTTICKGDTALLKASNGTRYIWEQDTTLSCLCCEAPKAFPTEQTTYTLTGVDTSGCKASDEVTVSIAPKPNLQISNDTIICPGESVSVQLSGTPSYIWYDDTTKNCSNCNSIDISPKDSNSYVVGGASNQGCIVLDTITIDVYPPPKTSSSTPPALCKGDTAQLGVTGALTYNWSPDSSLTNPNIADPKAFPEINTDYIVQGLDTNGCDYRDTVPVTVNVLQPGSFITDSSICIGEDITLFAKGFSTYEWSPDSSLSCKNCPEPIATPTTTTTYTASVADSNGCNDIDSVTITVNTLPNISVNVPKDSFCLGESVQMVASGGVDYSWSPTLGLDDPNIFNPTAEPTNDIEYTLTVQDVNGCVDDTTQSLVVHPLPNTSVGPDTAICFEDTIQLFATGADSFRWEGGGNSYITCTDCPDPVVAPEFTTVYTVTGFNQFGCTYKDTIEVQVNPEPSAISISEDTTICAGDSVQLSVSGGNSYQWLSSANLSCDRCPDPIASPKSTELYSVQVSSNQGCYRYFDVEVEVRELPITTVTSDTGICDYNSLTLEATGGSTYEWQPAGSLSDPASPTPEADPEASTTYYVKVLDDIGCFSWDTVFVDVYTPADPNAQPDTIICEYKPLTVSAENGISYSWNPAVLFDDPTASNPTTELSSSQEIIVEIVDSNNCQNQDTIFADVKSAPKITTSGDVEVYEGDQTTIAVQGASYYSWEPIDFIIDSGRGYITVFPEDTIEYVVTGYTQYGCSIQDSVTVTPITKLEIYMPNAFTPNNDGKNDRFRVQSNDKYELEELKIYDRWGNLIYQTSNPSEGWDGTVGGDPMPIGTYVFYVKARDQIGKVIEKKGNCILIR